jgi:hypothetical protein
MHSLYVTSVTTSPLDNPAITFYVRILTDGHGQCTPCRQRKVRCDRKAPCTQCTRKRLQCLFPAGIKPRAKKQRAPTADDKLDDISQRVDRICDMMQSGTPSEQIREPRQQINHDSLAPVARPASHSSRSTPLSVGRYSQRAQQQSYDGQASDSDLEGDSVLATHATFATQFVQKALQSQPPNISAEVTSSLSALRRILLLQDEKKDSSRDRTPDVTLIPSTPPSTDVGLPDVSLSMKAVQRLQQSVRVRIFWKFEFDSVAQFVEYFFTAYSGQPSIAVLIIVNAGLERLFAECSNVETDEALSNDFNVHGAAICRRNLDSTLSRLPLQLPTTFDYTLALYMAVRGVCFGSDLRDGLANHVCTTGRVPPQPGQNIESMELSNAFGKYVPEPRSAPRRAPAARDPRGQTPPNQALLVRVSSGEAAVA